MLSLYAPYNASLRMERQFSFCLFKAPVSLASLYTGVQSKGFGLAVVVLVGLGVVGLVQPTFLFTQHHLFFASDQTSFVPQSCVVGSAGLGHPWVVGAPLQYSSVEISLPQARHDAVMALQQTFSSVGFALHSVHSFCSVALSCLHQSVPYFFFQLAHLSAARRKQGNAEEGEGAG